MFLEALMLCFMILGEKKYSRNQFLMNWAKTEQILKTGAETRIKELKPWWLIKENFMEEMVLEYFDEFQWFWVVLEERKKKEEFWTLRRIFRN